MIIWTPWITHPGIGEESIGVKVLGIEYSVEITEGTNMGLKVSSLISTLYHKIVSPGYKYLFTLPQDIDGMMFEYLLSVDSGTASSSWSDDVDMRWGISRGNSVDFADYEDVRRNRKGVLPNRQASIQFTDEVVQDKLNTITGSATPSAVLVRQR